MKSWQELQEPYGSELKSDRLKVPGGWLIRSYCIISHTGGPYAGSSAYAEINTIFVSDPNHMWNAEE